MFHLGAGVTSGVAVSQRSAQRRHPLQLAERTTCHDELLCPSGHCQRARALDTPVARAGALVYPRLRRRVALHIMRVSAPDVAGAAEAVARTCALAVCLTLPKPARPAHRDSSCIQRPCCTARRSGPAVVSARSTPGNGTTSAVCARVPCMLSWGIVLSHRCAPPHVAQDTRTICF